jgi:hypothetical protein
MGLSPKPVFHNNFTVKPEVLWQEGFIKNQRLRNDFKRLLFKVLGLFNRFKSISAPMPILLHCLILKLGYCFAITFALKLMLLSFFVHSKTFRGVLL